MIGGGGSQGANNFHDEAEKYLTCTEVDIIQYSNLIILKFSNLKHSKAGWQI